MQSGRTASLEVTVAAALGIATGLVSAWIVFSIHLPAHLDYSGLFPTVASLLVFGAIVATRLSNVAAPIWRIVVAIFCGLAVVLTIGSVLIQMIGCRYDACINL
jgi:hypothetical protein